MYIMSGETFKSEKYFNDVNIGMKSQPVWFINIIINITIKISFTLFTLE